MILKALVLDYPLKCLETEPWIHHMLGDIVKSKQLGFLRTDPHYVVMDKHDMIGTHFLIFDMAHIYSPKLVLAIRNTYEERTQEHGLQLPIEGYIHLAGPRALKLLEDVRKQNGYLVDCNSWFVHPDYTLKHSGLRLSELGFLLVISFILRKGQHHFVGAGNERYKVSRWVRQVGKFPEGLEFIHPQVPDPHCVTLVQEFNWTWLTLMVKTHSEFLLNTQEVLGSPKEIQSLSDFVAGFKVRKLTAA